MKIIAAVLMSLALCFGGVSAKEAGVVGKWQGDSHPGMTWMFLADGTCILSNPGAEVPNVVGKWSTMPDGRILMQFTGMYGTQAVFAHMENGVLVFEEQPPSRLQRVK